MSKTLKDHLTIGKVGATIIVTFLLGAFCYYANLSLIIPLFLLFFGIHLFFIKVSSVKLYINVSLLLAIIMFAAHAFISYTNISILNLPVASVAMLTMLLFSNLQLAFMMAFVSSVLVCLVAGGGIGLMLTYFLGGLMSIYSIREARTRSHLILAGLYIGFVQCLCVVLLNFDFDILIQKDFLLQYVWPLMVNGVVVAFVVMATSKIFESLFGVLTNFSLLEMSDFNHPLLKRMVLEAPGTYHHSLIVSHLSEAASDAIGANALLTRVGAYYHDIGKMVKPEYFTENQLGDGNKHDKIEPSMSRLVILNHVKEGVELAKKNKLNPKIIDFIPQHHGTSLIYYFYQKALEEAEDQESVKEENFRYPGPKPQTRETAIVMLADSVEGATRAIDEPNPTKIEEVVRKIINNKFIDGQLDECNLTLTEIDKIAVTFTRVLSAMYHGRVKYPEKKNGHSNGDHSRKQAEKNPPESNQNQADHPKGPET